MIVTFNKQHWHSCFIYAYWTLINITFIQWVKNTLLLNRKGFEFKCFKSQKFESESTELRNPLLCCLVGIIKLSMMLTDYNFIEWYSSISDVTIVLYKSDQTYKIPLKDHFHCPSKPRNIEEGTIVKFIQI